MEIEGRQVDGVIVRPSDTLVVRLDGDLPMDRLQDVADRLKAELPGIKTLVINAAQILVFRPDGVS